MRASRPRGVRGTAPSEKMTTATVQCPYCGEHLDVFIDRSVARQEYIEDCQVCCRPITLRVTIDPDDDTEARVDARSEEE